MKLFIRASLVAQIVKNQPAIWETWVWSLGWEDPLEKGMATHSSTLAWRIPMDRGAWWAAVHGVTKSLTDGATKHSTAHILIKNLKGIHLVRSHASTYGCNKRICRVLGLIGFHKLTTACNVTKSKRKYPVLKEGLPSLH